MLAQVDSIRLPTLAGHLRFLPFCDNGRHNFKYQGISARASWDNHAGIVAYPGLNHCVVLLEKQKKKIPDRKFEAR